MIRGIRIRSGRLPTIEMAKEESSPKKCLIKVSASANMLVIILPLSIANGRSSCSIQFSASLRKSVIFASLSATVLVIDETPLASIG